MNSSETVQDQPAAAPIVQRQATVGLWDLFVIFFKSSLAFGGGLGIVAIMEDELVHRRRLVTREEFLTIYAMGRITPSGTMTALAVAYGYRFRGWTGTVVALVALVLPAFVLTVALTIAYQYLAKSPLLVLMPVTVLPAALALIVTAAIRLGRDVFRPSIELVVAVAALVAVVFFHQNSSLLLVLGGVAGALIFQPRLERLK